MKINSKEVAAAIIMLALGIYLGSLYHESFASQSGQIELGLLLLIGIVMSVVANRKK